MLMRWPASGADTSEFAWVTWKQMGIDGHARALSSHLLKRLTARTVTFLGLLDSGYRRKCGTHAARYVLIGRRSTQIRIR